MRLTITYLLLLLATELHAADGKLIATPGISQFEGSGGGGLVPWAQLAGYDSREQWSANAFCSHGNVDDYELNVCGAQLSFFDRLELSFAKQRFEVEALDTNIAQRVFGAKLRLFGDAVYSSWPQVSVGIQHKKLDDDLIGRALGADTDSGNDYYIAASKVHLGAVAGFNWLWNVTARSTEAHQTGFLGFGDEREWVWEASTALLLTRELALGVEYRQKPDNLAIRESDWRSVFIAWFPNKNLSLAAAWLDLGDVAGAEDQSGSYFSVTGYF